MKFSDEWILRHCPMVAPFMGAWIEILDRCMELFSPSVAPFMGAWIEIKRMSFAPKWFGRRTLHGCVD